ncbi:MAG: hypothetical protein JW724_05825 [Candidatus Altiarchaeota archaeon]|nr:hypothetical protein [Candidatus Altiarchaeota archaeon]
MVEAVAKATAKIICPEFGNGASFALDLDAKADVRLAEGSKGIRGRIDPGIKKLAKEVLDFLDCDLGVEIKTESGIPGKAGLGELEALSVAVVLATAGEIAKRQGSINELKIDKYVREQFLVVNGRLVDKKELIDVCTLGEFDRVCSSFYGGFTVCENRQRNVLRRGEMESTLHYVAIVPEKKETDKDVLLYRNEAEAVFNEALNGNLYTAMKLNGLLYCDRISKKMLSAGALTATVSHPSTVGLTRDAGKVKDIMKAVKEGGAIFSGKVSNEPATLLVKPRKIVKTKEFLALKGADEYHLL